MATHIIHVTRIAAVLALSLGFAKADHAIAQAIPRAELRRRTDSLAALSPGGEARRALARGDRRLVAVCGYACRPPGVELNDSIAATRATWRAIVGTSDAVLNPDVERLNRVALAYAVRYNQVIVPPHVPAQKVQRPAI